MLYTIAIIETGKLHLPYYLHFKQPHLKISLQLLRLFSLLFLGFFFACEEPVDLDIEAVKPQLVVDGIFSKDHPFQIVLSKSGNVLTNEPTQFIDNAKVSIRGEDNKLLAILEYQDDPLLPSYYSEAILPATHTNYHLSIDVPNYSTLIAVDQIPKPVVLSGITVDTMSIAEESVLLTTNIKEPIGQKHYYHLLLFHEVVNGRTHSNGFVENKDVDLMPLPIAAIPDNIPNAIFDVDKFGILFSDENIDGQALQLKLIAVINDLEMGMFPKIVGELRTVSENYYQYYTSLARQQESKDRPFSEPVSVFTNIENGVGIFAGYSTYRDSVTVVQ